MYLDISKYLLLLTLLRIIPTNANGQSNSSNLLLPCTPSDKCKQSPSCECLKGGITNLSVLDSLVTANWTTIDLSFNRIASIRENEFNRYIFNDFLKELFLENNEISAIEKNGFQDLINLEILSLSYNKLENISSGAFDNPSLKTLGLSNCSLEKLDVNIFSKLVNLEIIYLNGNHIKNVSRKLFKAMINITKIYMQNNQLIALDKNTFNGLTKLEVINLSDNQITILEKGLFKSLNNLKSLDLDNNNLTYLDADTVKELNLNTVELYLTNNQWDCDNCQLMKALQWCNKNKFNLSIICSKTEKYNNTMLSAIEINKHECFLETTTIEEITTTGESVKATETVGEEIKSDMKVSEKTESSDDDDVTPEGPELTTSINNNQTDVIYNNTDSSLNVTDGNLFLLSSRIIPECNLCLPNIGNMCVYQYYFLGSYAACVFIVACGVWIIIYRVKKNEKFDYYYVD